MKGLAIFIYLFFLVSETFGQLVIEDSRFDLSLQGVGRTTFLASLTHEKRYYYLPEKLVLAKENEVPQFYFFIGRNKDQEEVQYGIIHMLLTWGLGADNKEKFESQLQEKDSSAILLGAVNLSVKQPGWEIIVEEDSILTNILNSGVSSASMIPTMAGSKWAIGFKFSGENLKIIEELLTFPEKLHTVIIRFNYQYQALVKEVSKSKNKIFDLKMEATFFDLIGSLN